MKFLLKSCRHIASLAVFVLIAGCAGTSTFSAYPNKVQPIISSMTSRTPLDLTQCLVGECKSSDLILYNMERGRYAHVVGNSDVSMSDFKTSMEKISENDRKALVSASDVGANVAAAMVNDNAIPYEGEGYERVLLHHYQALNYLKKKDLDGAGVEVRRANAEQNDALRRFEKEVEKSREDAEEKKIDANSTFQVNSRYAQMDEVAGKVKNSFQNAYTFYISGFIYELLQQPNDAYIDYKKALEIYPDNSYLQMDVFRLAAKLDMNDELDELKSRFTLKGNPFIDERNSDSGELLVLFEDGFVPQKHEVKIPLPAGKAGIISMAFPLYNDKWSSHTPLQVINDSKIIGITEPICDVRALAVKSLKEKVPVIATRQIIRAVAKGMAAAVAKEKMGGYGQLAANIYNFMSESADLRSWLTLPANAQIMRTRLPAGSHRLALKHPMVIEPMYADVEIPAEGKTVIQVVRAGSQLYNSATQFSKN